MPMSPKERMDKKMVMRKAKETEGGPRVRGRCAPRVWVRTGLFLHEHGAGRQYRPKQK